MRKGYLVMRAKEVKRYHVIQQVLTKRLKQSRAAELLKVSLREVRRLVKRVKADGAAGLVHRLRGKPSNRGYTKDMKGQVIQVYQGKYGDFGPTLAQEKLSEREKIRLGRETLRQWLMEAGLWQSKRRRQVHRVWRERKGSVGEMVQMDGSHHDWLEGRGPELVLMGYIDDASSRAFGRFYEYEGTLPAMDSFYRYTQRYGLPQSVYADRHTTYQSPEKLSIEDELSGRERAQSQFKRALVELGVELIPAYSPQAKGRIERLFGTFQDRLIKEMRLAGVKSLEEANRFLGRYLPRYNRRFSREPREAVDVHGEAVSPGELKRILAIKERRSVRLDNTIQYEGKRYLIESGWNGRRPKQVEVEIRIDAKMYVMDGARQLRYREIHEAPRKEVGKKREASGSQRRRIPGVDHPWRGFRLVGSCKSKAIPSLN